MYFVIAALPISITSGAELPAIVASNFWRWSPQFWYCTLTLTPGWSDWNCLLTEATRSGQPDCASTCSHTVMLFAADLFVAPDVAAVSAAARTTTSESATMLRLFIWMPPGVGGCSAAIGIDHWSLRRMLSQPSPACQYQLRRWS